MVRRQISSTPKVFYLFTSVIRIERRLYVLKCTSIF
jgi:hypothetical protein